MNGLIPARWRRPQAPQSAEQPAAAPHRDRLNAPSGVLRWRCATPAGGGHVHDTEWQARNEAALYAGSVVYPVVVEIEESAS